MNENVKAGTYVQIHRVELKPEERTGKIPEDTKKVPLESWVKGFLKTDGKIGETVLIETVTQRQIEGELIAVNPTYNYGFGKTYLPDLLIVGMSLIKIMREEQ
jgi:hypothetical protein